MNDNAPTRAEAERDAAPGPLTPGTRVRILHVDMDGFQGRDPHPDQECEGKLGTVIEYRGWEGESSSAQRELGDRWNHDGFLEAEDEREVFLSAGSATDDYPPTHFYRCVVDGLGVYDFTEFEIVEPLPDEQDVTLVKGALEAIAADNIGDAVSHLNRFLGRGSLPVSTADFGPVGNDQDVPF